jgi:hypothetical protein
LAPTQTPRDPGQTAIKWCNVWAKGEAPRKLPLSEADPSQGLLWIDLASGADPGEVLAQLSGICDGLTREMLEELLTPDEFSEGTRYADDQIRVITTFAVRADPPDPHDDEGPGRLIVSPVELLAAERWLLSCRHQQRIYAGPREPVEFAAPDDDAETVAAVSRKWHADATSTAGDLGVQVMLHLALGYAKAHRALYGWLELWELNLYEQDVEDPAIVGRERARLRQMWGLRAALRDWLSPLNAPGLQMDLGEAWLPASDHDAVKATDLRIDKALAALARLGETLRSSFQLLHLHEHQIERDRADRRLRQLEFIAVVFLIPTLVVGLYGSNTWLPGEHKVWGFLVMWAGLIVATGIGLILIRRAHQDRQAVDQRQLDARG